MGYYEKKARRNAEDMDKFIRLIRSIFNLPYKVLKWLAHGK